MGKYKLYLQNGYLDVENLIHSVETPYIYIIGARGIGKTYGTLKYLIENDIPFVYMRRTQTQIDTILNPSLNPLISVCRDIGMETTVATISKSVYGFYHIDAKGKPVGEPMGIAVALSTVKNIRGFDASRYKVLFFDEFIPEVHELPIKEEYFAFCNAIETMARNRELNGEEPMLTILASNSNNICNPYFMSLGIVNDVYSMSEHKEQNVKRFPDRCFTVVNLNKSPVSEGKMNTSLYKMNGDNAFTRMAIGNDYNVDKSRCRKVNYDEYECLAHIGEISVFVHKSCTDLHIGRVPTGKPIEYKITDYDIGRFATDFAVVEKSIYSSNTISYDSPVEEAYIRELFDMAHRKLALVK